MAGENVHAGRPELFAKLEELGIKTNTKDQPEVKISLGLYC